MQDLEDEGGGGCGLKKVGLWYVNYRNRNGEIFAVINI